MQNTDANVLLKNQIIGFGPNNSFGPNFSLYLCTTGVTQSLEILWKWQLPSNASTRSHSKPQPWTIYNIVFSHSEEFSERTHAAGEYQINDYFFSEVNVTPGKLLYLKTEMIYLSMETI